MKRKPTLPPAILQFFREQGRLGGKTGGKLRWKGTTKAERTAYARYLVDCRKKKRRA